MSASLGFEGGSCHGRIHCKAVSQDTSPYCKAWIKFTHWKCFCAAGKVYARLSPSCLVSVGSWSRRTRKRSGWVDVEVVGSVASQFHEHPHNLHWERAMDAEAFRGSGRLVAHRRRCTVAGRGDTVELTFSWTSVSFHGIDQTNCSWQR